MYELYGVPCCCLNHFIGLPEKLNDDGVSEPHPMYEYENILFDNLINKGIKWQWVKKSTGLGITEFYLRLIIWFCVNKRWRARFKGGQICIVVGPNLDLGKKLMRRTKDMFKNVLRNEELGTKPFELEGSSKEIVINGVTITVFPSNHLDAMRGLPKVPFILVDEGDYFAPNEQLNVLTVTTRYVAKSDVWIAMVSTPGLPGGLFETIEKDKKSPFDKQYFSYHWGMEEHGSNLFTEKMIEEAKMHNPLDFEREYNLAYKGFNGNLFSVEFLYQLQQKSLYYPVIEPLELVDEVNRTRRINLALFDNYVKSQNPIQYFRIMGLDTGYASSKTGIVIIQLNLRENKVEVIYENEFQGISSDLVDFVAYVTEVMNIKKIVVDRSDADIIYRLKEKLNDYTEYDYRDISKEDMKSYISGDMIVIPQVFNEESKRKMLLHLYDLIRNDHVRIHEDMRFCYDALATINIKQGGLKYKKEEVSHNDIFDALQMALYLVHT